MAVLQGELLLMANVELSAEEREAAWSRIAEEFESYTVIFVETD